MKTEVKTASRVGLRLLIPSLGSLSSRNEKKDILAKCRCRMRSVAVAVAPTKLQVVLSICLNCFHLFSSFFQIGSACRADMYKEATKATLWFFFNVQVASLLIPA